MAPQSPSRIVGYSVRARPAARRAARLTLSPTRCAQGFIPGEQHLHGETYGSSAGPSLRERADANNRGAFLKKSDVRCGGGSAPHGNASIVLFLCSSSIVL
eukprot:SAG31_NODE_1351_length_8676_cov_3.112044_7_plen_101_part_00